MPVLRNARHEAFAQAVANGSTADQAYSSVGYKPDRHHAARLATNGHIKARIEEIKARVAEKAEWTAADRLIGLKEIYDTVKAQDPRTAIAAINEANKMQGSHAPAKMQHQGPKGGPVMVADISKLKGMTETELDVLERALIQIGLAEGNQAGEGEPED